MADQNITALPVATAPASSDQFLLVGATEEKLIDYDKLADAILQKLTSKTFALDQGVMTLLKALNELNSKAPYVYSKSTVDNTNPVTIELESYSTYLLFMQHDGGNNSMISSIMSEATQKIVKITSSGDAFNATLKNQKLTITSTTTYWTYTIIKLS